MRPLLLHWPILIFAAASVGLEADILDSAFRATHPPIARGPDGPVKAFVSSSSDTVIIAGDFERVNGVRRQGIARLRANGTLNSEWNVGTGPDGPIHSLAAGTEGTVLVGGEFSNWGGVPAGGHVVRLKPDGSRDDSFDSGPVWDGEVIQVLALEDGNTLVLGRQWQDGEIRPVLRRLLVAGGPDPSFTPEIPAGASLNALARTADDQVLVVGRFQSFGGQALTNIVRLRSDGTADATFRPPAAAESGEWYCVAVAEDGRIALGGVVTNTFPGSALAVLQPNGETDPDFVRPFGLSQAVVRASFDASGHLLLAERWPGTLPFEFLYRISPTGDSVSQKFYGAIEGAAPFPLADGRVWWALDGVTVAEDGVWNWLLETLLDGSVNPQFNPGLTQDADLPWPVFTLAQMPDGDVVVPGGAGLRTNLTTGARAFQQDLLRLDSNGAVREGFTAVAASRGQTFQVLWGLEDDRIFAAGGLVSVNWETNSPLVAVLNGDGSRDPGFTAALKAPDDFRSSVLYDAFHLVDGRVLIAGNFEFLKPSAGTSREVLLARLLPDGSPDPAFKSLMAPRDLSQTSIQRLVAWDGDHCVFWGTTQAFGTPALFRYTADGELTPGPLLENGNSGPVSVSSMVRLPDDRILVAGSFDRVGGLPRKNLVRLRADLSVDPEFDVGVGPGSAVSAIAALSDGRILVGGAFTQWNGLPRRRLVLLRSDGSVDPAFDAGSGPDDAVFHLTEQLDGQVLVGGRFGNLDGRGSPRLVRITIPSQEPRIPAHLVVQPASMIATQTAATVTLSARAEGTPPLRWQWYRNGIPLLAADGYPGVSASSLVIPVSRLRDAAAYHVEVFNDAGRERSATAFVGIASGTMETGFTTNSATGKPRLSGISGRFVTGLFADRDPGGRARRILIVGTFTEYDGVPVPGLVVVYPDGSRDSQWSPPAGVTGSDTVRAAFRTDGSVVLAGKFSRTRGAPRDVVLQLSPDGSLDETFDPGDELAVTPPAGFPRQTAAVGLALDADGLFVSSSPGLGGPNGFVRRLDAAGRTDTAFMATNILFYGPPTVLSVEPRPDGGLLIGGDRFAAQLRQGSPTLFRGVARFLRNGRLDTNYNATPRLPDSSANGDVTAVIPLADGRAWVAGDFPQFDQAPGPLVGLDSRGIADTNFAVRITSDPVVVFPGRNLLGAELRGDGDLLLNYRPGVKGLDSIVRMDSQGGLRATAGGPVEDYRSTGPVLDLGDGSYVTPIMVRLVFPAPTIPSVGRFWLTDLAAMPSAILPPVVLWGPADTTISHRAGFREPLVLSAVVQSGVAVEFRWFLNDALIEGQTNALLTILDPQPSHSGRYHLEAANAFGMAKAEALVTVVNPPSEAPRLSAEWIPGERPLRLRFQPVTGYQYRLESSGNLSSWTPLEDPAAVISPDEFAPRIGDGPEYYRLVQDQ